jgi:predicted RND superfamily exporter protein
VQPRDPINLDGFVAALRGLVPSATGKALIETDTRRLLREGMPWLLAGWLAAIIIAPVPIFRNARGVLRVAMPVTAVALLALGGLALALWPLYPESIAVLAFMLALGAGAAMASEAWRMLPPEEGMRAPDSSRRAVLVAFLLLLAGFGPLTLSQSEAAQDFGGLVFLAVAATAVGQFLILPQLRGWTAPRQGSRR